MKETLQIGMIGCGRAAERLYLPALTRIPQASLVAAADPLPERRALVAAQAPGCRTFPSVAALLAACRPDASIVATTPASHAPVAAELLRAGVPVLVEKPLADSLQAVGELRELVGSGGLLMVGFNRRFWQPVRALRRALQETESSATATACLTFISDAAAWDALSGPPDPLDDLASHQFDLLRFLFADEIAALRARAAGPQAVRLEVRMEGGVRAECLVAQGGVEDPLDSPAARETIEVWAGPRRYRLHSGSERIAPAGGPLRLGYDLMEALQRRLLGRRSSLRESIYRQLLAFFESLHTNKPPQPGFQEGVAALQAVEAARRSLAGGGKEVSL